jgi:hypothetical protein
MEFEIASEDKNDNPQFNLDEVILWQAFSEQNRYFHKDLCTHVYSISPEILIWMNHLSFVLQETMELGDMQDAQSELPMHVTSSREPLKDEL